MKPQHVILTGCEPISKLGYYFKIHATRIRVPGYCTRVRLRMHNNTAARFLLPVICAPADVVTVTEEWLLLGVYYSNFKVFRISVLSKYIIYRGRKG